MYELGLQADSIAKRKKIDDLKLSEEEWERIKLFTSLLTVSLLCFIVLILMFCAACR